jgi:regulator of sirC expression with transglutaminase-like and TPR domain
MAKPEEQPSEVGERLYDVMRQPEERISLAEAALVIAGCEYPDLDRARYIRRLDDMAATLAPRVPERTDPLHVISQINRFLFMEEGFCGNTQDYYDPRNSFLNDVLDRKTGIPIMLSTVYLELADRLRFPLVGVGMPGHYLVRHPYFDILIDPFTQGRILAAADCEKRMREVLGESVPFHESYLDGVSKLHTVTRMLNNLRNVYLSLRQFPKALQITELVLILHPDSPDETRQKAAFLLELRRYSEALAALERYLELAPKADDAEELKQTAVNLRRTLAQLN